MEIYADMNVMRSYHSVLQRLQNVLQGFPVVRQLSLLPMKMFVEATFSMPRVRSTHFRCEHHWQVLFPGIFFWTRCPVRIPTGRTCPAVFSANRDSVLFSNFVNLNRQGTVPLKGVLQCCTAHCTRCMQYDRLVKLVRYKMIITPGFYCNRLLI